MDKRPYIFLSALFVLTFIFVVAKTFWVNLALSQEPQELKEEVIEPSPYYVGNRECRICHPRNFQLWHVEKHAVAFESLGRMEDNPYCLKCHTTGFGEKGGYVNQVATPHMEGVQCESCHGPGSGHIKAPKDKKSLTIKTHLDYENTCKRCHDKDWDPEFDYRIFRPKIEHELKAIKPEYKLKPH